MTQLQRGDISLEIQLQKAIELQRSDIFLPLVYDDEIQTLRIERCRYDVA